MFLGVFAMSKDKDIKEFANKYRIGYPVGKENGIAEALGAKGIPETFFISKEGMIVKRYSDVITFLKLTTEINKLLK